MKTLFFLLCFLALTFSQCLSSTKVYTKSLTTASSYQLKLNSNFFGQTSVFYYFSNTTDTIRVDVTSSADVMDDLNEMASGVFVAGTNMEINTSFKTRNIPVPTDSSGNTLKTNNTLLYLLVFICLSITGFKPFNYSALFIFAVLMSGPILLADSSIEASCDVIIDVYLPKDVYLNTVVTSQVQQISYDCGGIPGSVLVDNKCYLWAAKYKKSWSSPDNPTSCDAFADLSEYTILGFKDYFYVSTDLSTKIYPDYEELESLIWNYKGKEIVSFGQSFVSLKFNVTEGTCEYAFTCQALGANGTCKMPSTNINQCGLPSYASLPTNSSLNCTLPEKQYCPYYKACKYSCSLNQSASSNCSVCDPMSVDNSLCKPQSCFCSITNNVSNAMTNTIHAIFTIIIMMVGLLLVETK